MVILHQIIEIEDAIGEFKTIHNLYGFFLIKSLYNQYYIKKVGFIQPLKKFKHF